MEIGVILPAFGTPANTAGSLGKLCDDGKCAKSPLLDWHWLTQLTEVSSALLATGLFCLFFFLSAAVFLCPQQQHLLSEDGLSWREHPFEMSETNLRGWQTFSVAGVSVILACQSQESISLPRLVCLQGLRPSLHSLFCSQSRHPSEAWRHRNAPRPSTLRLFPYRGEAAEAPLWKATKTSGITSLCFSSAVFTFSPFALFFSPSLSPLCSGLCAAVEYTMRSSRSLPEGRGGAGQGLW